jgi:hypothetical protein
VINTPIDKSDHKKPVAKVDITKSNMALKLLSD